MKAIRIIGFIVSIIALIYYGYRLLGKPNGSEYKYDSKHHVYYKGDGVNKDDAKNTAEALKQVGLFTSDNEIDVQIKAEKKSDNVTLSFVSDKEKLTPELEKSLLDIGAYVNVVAFKGRKVSVSVADDGMDEIKNLGVVPQGE